MAFFGGCISDVDALFGRIHDDQGRQVFRRRRRSHTLLPRYYLHREMNFARPPILLHLSSAYSALMHFELIDYVPWLGSVTAEAIVVAIMLKQRLVRRFPLFFVSLTYDLLRQIVLAAVLSQSPKAYPCAYW